MDMCEFIGFLTWMDIFKISTIIAVMGLVLFVLIKVLNWQELKTLIPEVIRYIMEVEKENRDYLANSKILQPISSAIKLQTVVNRIEENNPEIVATVKKTSFRNIGRFVQYVFTNFAEAIILRKYK